METDLKELFFNEEEFAESVTIVPQTGEPYDISAIFDDEYQELDAGSSSIQSSSPQVSCAESSLKTPIGPKFRLIRKKTNTTYSIIPAKPDGTGEIKLFLKKV